MIKKRKQLKMSLALIALGVSIMLGCSSGSNSTGGSGSDTTAPTLQSSNPSRGSENFSADANITLTYSEPVQAGTGNITITPAGGNAITIAVGDAQVSIAGAVTLKPTDDLELRTGYVLTIPAGAFMDAAGNKTAELILSFITAAALDETAPTVSSSVPVADATDFPANSNIILTYSEPVLVGTGNISITPSGGNAITIAVTDTTQVSIAGAVVTINPTNSLAVSTTYTLTVPASAIVDASGNAGSVVTLSFSTVAAIAPIVISSVPATDGINFPIIRPTFTLTFSEAVQAGTGDIEIAGGGSRIRVSVGSGVVSISGAVVMVDLLLDLDADTAYTLSFVSGVFVSSADQTPVLDFSLNFTTLDTTPPTLASSNPSEAATDFSADANITLTYSEPVLVGTGSITLVPMDSGATLTIPVGDAQVSIVGAVVTINPTNNLVASTMYTLTVPAGAFMDAAGNTTAENTLSFSTAN